VSYWTFDGTVGLKGVEGTLEVLDDCFGRCVYHPDVDNPVVLRDDIILYALRTSRRARADFRRLFPTLLPEEQERLTALLEANPRISALVEDDQRFNDRIQAEDVRSIPVRTSGKRGGKGYGRAA
jgi:hypothetical protein